MTSSNVDRPALKMSTASFVEYLKRVEIWESRCSTTTPDHSTFPLEISTSFLEHLDWAHVWENRIVCRGWCDYVENNLAPRIWLPDVQIRFKSLAGDCTFAFECLGEGGDAIFVDASWETESIKNLKAEKLKKKAVRRWQRVSRPIVTMSHYAHDIKVPGMTVDWSTMTMRVRWRDLFVEFLSIENTVLKRFRQSLRQQRENFIQLKAQADAGPLRIMEAWQKILDDTGDALEEAYRGTRAQRIGLQDHTGDESLRRIRYKLVCPDGEGEDEDDLNDDDEESDEDDESEEEEESDEDNSTSEDEWITEDEGSEAAANGTPEVAD